VFASISVTTYNRKKLSKFCIETIRDRTPRDEYELIVIDNRSTDGTVPMLKNFKAKGVIDKLVLKHTNSLGKAINDAWKLADIDADWIIVLSNDMFCMEGWFENFKLIVQSSLKPDYVFCVLRMPGFAKRVPHETKNGGSFVTRTGKWELGYPFGGGLAVKKSLINRSGIQFAEGYSTWLRRSIYTGVCSTLFMMHLRCTELGKPCLLFQDCEFGNPKYEGYYRSRFNIASVKKDSKYDRRVRKFENLKRIGYTKNPDAYYEGSGYKISKFYRDALEKKGI